MTAPMPTSSDRFPGHSLPGGSSLIITRMSKHKSAAWKLIHYLVDAQTQLQFHKLTGNLPSNREAWEMPQLKNDPYMKAFFIQLQYLRSTPKIPEWEQIATKIMEYTELAANRSTPNEELLEALNKDVNRILEKRRWLFEHNALSGQKR
jgi:multiple sugar transport system substrate-binding protein